MSNHEQYYPPIEEEPDGEEVISGSDQELLPTSSNIDVPRLRADLGLTDEALHDLAVLDIPTEVTVASVSPIKTDTVADVLRIIQPEPGQEHNVRGKKVPSGVDEQPLGQTAIDGALNRLHSCMTAEDTQEGINARAWLSIENGLFRVSEEPGVTEPVNRRAEGVMQFTEGADLTPELDPNAQYEDRTVVAFRIPGHPTVVQVSPASEAVRFPSEAVMAAANAQGGLVENTAGSQLAEMGIVEDKQNPHTELTVDRPGGPLPRQDQMARALIRGLLRLASSSE
jgi:hypothetical protein